jgi:hypothetical protein
VDRRSLGDDAVHVEDEGSCPARDASAFSPVALSPASPAVATVCSNWAFTTKLTGARFSTYDAARTRIDERLRRCGPLGAKHAIGFVPSTTGGHLATYDVVIEQPYESMGVIAPAALIGLCHNLAADRKHAWNGLRQVCAPPRGRSGRNSSGGRNARWIALWPVHSLVHLIVLVYLITALIGDDSSIRHRNIALAPCPRADEWSGARRPLLDERGYRATLVTGDRLELRPGAGVENQLSARLNAVFVFQITLSASSPASRHRKGHE